MKPRDLPVQQLQQRGNQKRRVNCIDEDDSEEKHDDERQLVLRVDGKGQKLFYMGRLMCGQQFIQLLTLGHSYQCLTKG